MRLDLERCADHGGGLDLAGIDFDAFRERPLDAATLRCLRYMHDVEHHTVCYLRDLLVTPPHRDPRGHHVPHRVELRGDVARRGHRPCLAAHGEDAGAPRVAGLRQRLGLRDRVAPALHAVGAAVAGEAFGAST